MFWVQWRVELALSQAVWRLSSYRIIIARASNASAGTKGFTDTRWLASKGQLTSRCSGYNAHPPWLGFAAPSGQYPAESCRSDGPCGSLSEPYLLKGSQW